MTDTRPGQNCRNPHRRRHRHGFTLVEVLTAVAIIAILSSLGFLAYKYVGGSMRGKNAEVTLQNLRGMLAEFEAQGGRMADIVRAYRDPSVTTPTPTNPADKPLAITVVDSTDPVKDPYGKAFDPDKLLVPDAADTKRIYLPLAAKTAVNYGEPFFDVYTTAYRVMPRLAAIPANKAVLDSLPKEQVFPRKWEGRQGLEYKKGMRVVSGNDYFVCKTTHTVGASSTPPAKDASGTKSADGNWDLDLPNLLILDAQGVPILFVPPQGAVMLGEGGNRRVLNGTGLTAPKQSPDRKGYFMSAGEDHNHAAADDNVYSFENK